MVKFSTSKVIFAAGYALGRFELDILVVFFASGVVARAGATFFFKIDSGFVLLFDLVACEGASCFSSSISKVIDFLEVVELPSSW